MKGQRFRDLLPEMKSLGKEGSEALGFAPRNEKSLGNEGSEA